MGFNEICLYLALGVLTYGLVSGVQAKVLHWPETIIVLVFWPVILVGGFSAAMNAAVDSRRGKS